MDSMHHAPTDGIAAPAPGAPATSVPPGAREDVRATCVSQRVEAGGDHAASIPAGAARTRHRRCTGCRDGMRVVIVQRMRTRRRMRSMSSARRHGHRAPFSFRASFRGDAPHAKCLHGSSKSCARQSMCKFVSECSFHLFPLARALLRARCRLRRRRCHAMSSSRFASVSDTSAHFLSYPAHGVKGSTSVSSRSTRRS